MDNSSNAIPYLNKGMSGKVIPETCSLRNGVIFPDIIDQEEHCVHCVHISPREERIIHEVYEILWVLGIRP